MSSTMTESKNGTSSMDVEKEIQELKKSIEVQAATEAGAHATQAATHAGTGARCSPAAVASSWACSSLWH